jgi:2'-5' RNA ligase
MSKENLLFIALIPDRELRQKINIFKNDFSKRFDSHKALKVYPHITMKAPFKCNDNGKDELLNWFSDLHIRQKKFDISLKGFGAFHNKNNPVVYVNPVITKEIQTAQEELIAGFGSLFPGYLHPFDKSFKPHVTIAYRDLTPAMFEKGWKEYKDKFFDEIFHVHSIYLLQHDSKKWNVISTYELE